MPAPSSEAHVVGKPLPKLAYTVPQVAVMLEESEFTIKQHCRTQALKGAYKPGGKTSPWRIPPAAISHYQRTRSNH